VQIYKFSAPSGSMYQYELRAYQNRIIVIVSKMGASYYDPLMSILYGTDY